MIRLRFAPPNDDGGWNDWVERGRAKATALLSTGGGTIDEDLYKEQRRLLLDASHQRCAYCEHNIVPGQRHGDVEHYRPKGRVRGRDGSVVTMQRDGVTVPHPGYYWLAYDPHNLLPSCLACNRRAADVASGIMTGKGEIFPVLNGVWATGPEEIEREEPGLLNPWIDEPERHLVFNTATGIVGPKTARGEVTIAILGLNREGLPEDRKRACLAVRDLFARVNADLALGREHQDDLDRIAAVRDLLVEYAAISLQALLEAKMAVTARLDDIIGH